MNREEVEKYFEQQLSATERHQMEKQSQLDPFDYEAMEGYEQHGFSEAELNDLSQRLENRVMPERKRNAAAWWKIGSMAAGIGIILGLLGGWLIFGLKLDLKKAEVAQLQDNQKEDKIEADNTLSAPVLADSVKVMDIERGQSVSTISQSEANQLGVQGEPIADVIVENGSSTFQAEAEAAPPASPAPSISKEKSKSIFSNESNNKDVSVTSSDLAKTITNEAKVKELEAPKPISTIAAGSANVAERAEVKDKVMPVTIAKKEERKSVKARDKVKDEPAYKNAGESITLGGLADMLKQEKNEDATATKADGNQAPSIVLEEKKVKKSEPFKYDYDKLEQGKAKTKSVDEGVGRKKSKIQIPLDALPVNITFEDYVKIKLRDKAFRCPKRGSVKLIVNLDKNKKIEDFTMMEVNNKICVDYAKAILEEWISEKASLYDENRAYQFVVKFE